MSESNTHSAPVIFAEITTENGLKIGHATLVKPKALNALDLEMIQLLTSQLKKWQDDPEVVMVLLDGSGERAFCAGGDIVSMYNSMVSAKKGEYSLQAFFTQEYQLDHLIHTYSKPLMVWGNGIVMGGGLGLMNGASHRIVTESSRIAMPEISIGLYPDVGGSHFLNKMPKGCGLFLGLTGASINATDALHVGLADHIVADNARSHVVAALSQVEWSTDAVEDNQLLTKACHSLAKKYAATIPVANMPKRQDWFNQLNKRKTLSEAVAFIMDANWGEHKWLSKAQKTLAAGSPITAHLVFEQLKRANTISLAECFEMELTLSCKCGELGEFQEGVRALLIDKDNHPNWLYKTVDDVPRELVDGFFESIWPAETHPLRQLAKS